jgi:hypothetical protein
MNGETEKCIQQNYCGKHYCNAGTSNGEAEMGRQYYKQYSIATKYTIFIH